MKNEKRTESVYLTKPWVKRIRAPKVPFNFQIKIKIEQDIFEYFNFYFKIENWRTIIFFFNFQLLVLLKNWNLKIHFHFSFFQFNCRITQVERIRD